MVKHQRRSHQRGIHSSEIDDSMSETGSEDSPATPKSHSMPWPPQGMPMMGHHGHHLHRAQSFADFGQHMNGFNIQQQYGHRHSLSSGGAHEYHGHPQHQGPLPHEQHQPQQPQHQQHQQHPGVHMLQRTASLPQHSYFVTEQNNPGVATMNTNPHAAAAPMHAQYQQVPRQGVERLPLEIPYSSAPGLTGSIQSSPSSFSAASGRSPSTQDGFYTHAPTAQAATYALHTASPVEQQQPQMVSFQSQMSQAPPPQAVQQPPQTQQTAPEYQQQHTQAEEQQWYNGVAYQPPVEVATIGQLPAYGSNVYDPWGPKIEFEDPSMQLPSARIENM
jgi:hypothetical protein